MSATAMGRILHCGAELGRAGYRLEIQIPQLHRVVRQVAQDLVADCIRYRPQIGVHIIPSWA